MRIVRPAAGVGSRLGNPSPKPLTNLRDGRSIMQRRVDAISTSFDASDVMVVVGFKKDMIMEAERDDAALRAVDVGSGRCIEVDFPEDLRQADQAIDPA